MGIRQSRLWRIAGAVINGPERFDSLRETAEGIISQLDVLQRRATESEARLEMLENQEEEWYIRLKDRLAADHQWLENMNRELSTHPTLWGSAERLHIDSTAAVFPCLFNTNSGEITIGEYSFAGSRVSLLAGSHDPELMGFLRRDVEITEGCDIVIGKGVWLASDCTLLGPCRVGDHAVIAAGAVVTPGTEVPAGCIYGGVPAREIGRVEIEEKVDSKIPAIQRALERSGGFLYVSGWSDRINEAFDGRGGHWMMKEGKILTSCAQAQLRVHLADVHMESVEITMIGDGRTQSLHLEEGITEVELPVREGTPGEVIFQMETEGAQVLMRLESRSRYRREFGRRRSALGAEKE